MPCLKSILRLVENADAAKDRVAYALMYAQLVSEKLEYLRSYHGPDEAVNVCAMYANMFKSRAGVMSKDWLHVENARWTDRLCRGELEDMLWKAVLTDERLASPCFSKRELLNDYVKAYGKPGRSAEMKLKAEASGDRALTELLDSV